MTRKICCVCGSKIVGPIHGPYAAGLAPDEYACDRCWHDPCLWFADRPDCIEFARKVTAARESEEAWSLSPDIRSTGEVRK